VLAKILSFTKDHKFIIIAVIIIVASVAIPAISVPEKPVADVGSVATSPPPTSSPIARDGETPAGVGGEGQSGESNEQIQEAQKILAQNLFTDHQGHYLIFFSDGFVEYDDSDGTRHTLAITHAAWQGVEGAEMSFDLWTIDVVVDGRISQVVLTRRLERDGQPQGLWACGSAAFEYANDYEAMGTGGEM
jgi:hypothetical protein